MTSRETEHDEGLRAVERVRRVREQDSKIGLQHALATSAAHVAELEATRMLLESHPGFSDGSVTDFQAHLAVTATIAAQHDRDRERAEASRGVAEEAGRRWAADRARVRAVELLLERRAAERRAARERREAAELDDLAGRAWLRDTTRHTRGKKS